MFNQFNSEDANQGEDFSILPDLTQNTNFFHKPDFARTSSPSKCDNKEVIPHFFPYFNSPKPNNSWEGQKDNNQEEEFLTSWNQFQFVNTFQSSPELLSRKGSPKYTFLESRSIFGVIKNTPQTQHGSPALLEATSSQTSLISQNTEKSQEYNLPGSQFYNFTSQTQERGQDVDLIALSSSVLGKRHKKDQNGFDLGPKKHLKALNKGPVNAPTNNSNDFISMKDGYFFTSLIEKSCPKKSETKSPRKNVTGPIMQGLQRYFKHLYRKLPFRKHSKAALLKELFETTPQLSEQTSWQPLFELVKEEQRTALLTLLYFFLCRIDNDDFLLYLKPTKLRHKSIEYLSNEKNRLCVHRESIFLALFRVGAPIQYEKEDESFLKMLSKLAPRCESGESTPEFMITCKNRPLVGPLLKLY